MQRPTLLLTVFLLILPPIAAGETAPEEETVVGRIIEVKDEVKIARPGGLPFRASVGSSLQPGDTITTGETGSAKFTLGDDDHFELGPSAEVTLDELAELADDDEDQQPVLRQALGFLRSVISGTRAETQPVIHTPTVVAGVRGTTFETVVSLDGATAVVVDEGTVEVNNETEKAVVNPGEMVELDVRNTALKTQQAPPKPKRDWQRWQGMKREELIPKIPGVLAAYRQNIDTWKGQYNDMLAAVRAEEQAVSEAVKKVGNARKSGDADQIEASTANLAERMRQMRETIKNSRHPMNRFKSIGRQVKKVAVFSWMHRKRFDKETRKEIESHIAFFKETGKELRADSLYLIRDLRKTVREARRINRHAK